MVRLDGRSRFLALVTSILLLCALVLPAGAAAPAGEVLVRVTEASGQPLPWATLEVYQLNHGLVTTAVTGLDGTARIANAAGRTGLWLIRASAEKYQVRETGWFDPAQGGTRTIVLEPISGELHLYVRDAGGKRLDGSYTLLTASGRLASQGNLDGGRLVIPAVAAGEYRITVAADGFTPVQRSLSVAPGRVTVETFVLDSRTLTVEGEVVDSTTTAVISGATVELLGDSGLLLAEGKTGSDGRFSLSAPNVAEAYRLRVSAPGYATILTEPRSPEGATNIDYFGKDRVALSKPTATIEGVLTGFGDETLEDVRLTLMRDGVGEVSVTVTNDDGRFRFEGLPAGGIRYKVVADNVKQDGWSDLVISDWVEPQPGATHWMSLSPDYWPDLGLTTGRLSGVVLSQSGVPLEGATVELIRYTRVVTTTTTNGAGEFDFDEVSATQREGSSAAPYMLRVSKKGYLDTRQVTVAGQNQFEFHVPEDGRVTVQVTLHPSSVTPKGRVVDESGMPVVDARVELTVTGKDRPTVARTDANGWYLLSPIPTHSVGAAIRVTADGYLPGDEIDITATLASGDRPPTIKLTKRNASVDGVVVDMQGKPVGGAKVQLWLDGQLAAETVAESDGYYALEADTTTVASGLLTVEQAGYTQGGTALDPLPEPGRRTTQPLVLQAVEAIMTGRVLDPQGNPVAGAKVELTLEGRREMEIATTSADGTYRFEVDLPSGAAWAWLRVRPVTGTFAGSLSHSMDMAPIVRLTAGDRVVTDLLVRP